MFDGDELVGDMPVEALVDDCPLYDIEPEKPAEQIYPAPAARCSSRTDPRECLLALLASPNLELPAAALRAVRPGGAVAHRAPA